jgi:hypothetical protein
MSSAIIYYIDREGERKERKRKKKWIKVFWWAQDHVLLYFVYFNSILALGGNGRAIGLV